MELGSQTLTLSFGDRMLEDVLAELVYRRHQLGPVPEGLCMQLCQVQPAPSQGRRELIVLLFCRATDGTYPIVCDGRDVGGHIWVAALDATVPFGALAESGCVPFLDGLPCPASPQLYPGAMVTLRSAHSGGRPLMMPVSAWWTVHPFSALIASPVPFPAVAPGSLGFQNAAIREAFNALLEVRIARGFALFEGRVAIFGPGSSLVFATGQEEPTAERIANDLSVYLLRTFGPGQVVFTRLHLANCALFVYRPASLRSELSLCLHSLGGGYVLRVVPTADLRTVQEPIFLFPGIDTMVAQVHEAEPHDDQSVDSDHEVQPAVPSAPAQPDVENSGIPAADRSSCPNAESGTSLAQVAFVRRMPRMPSPRCSLPSRPTVCEPVRDAEPQDAYATFALGDPRGSASSSDDSRRSSALSHLIMQEVPQYPMADVRVADARLVVGNGIPGPVPFTIFDVVRTISSDSYDPRTGVQDAIGRAIANAPFAPITWHFPALEVAPFPCPQVLLCRYFEQSTVIVDLRDCSLGLHVLEIDHAVDPLGLLGPELQTQLGPRVRSRAVQATLNGGSWNFGFIRWLRNGDVVVWRPIPASAILVPQGLRVPRTIARTLHDVYPLFSMLTLSSSGRPTTTVLLDSYNLAAALDAARARHILQPHVQIAAGQLDRVVCSRVQPQPDGKRLIVHCLTYSSSVRSPTILLDLRALGGSFGAVVSNALLHLDQVLTGIQCFVNGVLCRHPTPVFNGDLVVFVPIGGSPAPTVATHTLWPLFQALNFISAPCPVPRATLAEALAGPTVGVVAWGRQLRERARIETEGGHSELLIFTPAGVLQAAVTDTPPSAAQVAHALGSALADLLGAGTVSDVQRAFGDRSVFIFRPDALDIRLTIAIRQDGGSLLAIVLSRPEYMTSGSFFAASHSVSAEDQAHVDPGSVPVLWPNATGSLDFYMRLRRMLTLLLLQRPPNLSRV